MGKFPGLFEPLELSEFLPHVALVGLDVGSDDRTGRSEISGIADLQHRGHFEQKSASGPIVDANVGADLQIDGWSPHPPERREDRCEEAA